MSIFSLHHCNEFWKRCSYVSLLTNGEAHMPLFPLWAWCLFGCALHPNVTISHTTRAYIWERWKRRENTWYITKWIRRTERYNRRLHITWLAQQLLFTRTSVDCCTFCCIYIIYVMWSVGLFIVPFIFADIDKRTRTHNRS